MKRADDGGHLTMSDFRRGTGLRPAAIQQFHELSPWAATYIVAVAALAGFATYLGSGSGLGSTEYVGLAIGLAVAATVAQLSEVRTANNKAYVATISFFKSMPPEAWDRTGVASDNHVSVRAIAYIIAGHVAHHMNVLQEKYL